MCRLNKFSQKSIEGIRKRDISTNNYSSFYVYVYISSSTVGMYLGTFGIPIIADNATLLLSSRFFLLCGFGAVVLGCICNST